MTPNTQDGEQPDVHPPRWLGVTIPAQDTGNLPNAGQDSWNQAAGLRPSRREELALQQEHQPAGLRSGPELESWVHPHMPSFGCLQAMP